jgi:hypothetical protein
MKAYDKTVRAAFAVHKAMEASAKANEIAKQAAKTLAEATVAAKVAQRGLDAAIENEKAVTILAEMELKREENDLDSLNVSFSNCFD